LIKSLIYNSIKERFIPCTCRPEGTQCRDPTSCLNGPPSVQDLRCPRQIGHHEMLDADHLPRPNIKPGPASNPRVPNDALLPVIGFKISSTSNSWVTAVSLSLPTQVISDGHSENDWAAERIMKICLSIFSFIPEKTGESKCLYAVHFISFGVAEGHITQPTFMSI